MQKLHCNCKDKNLLDVYYRTEFFKPNIELGKPIIHYNRKSGVFEIRNVYKIEYDNENRYYFKDNDNFLEVDYPEYIHIEYKDPKMLKQKYNKLAYIDNKGLIRSEEIYKVYSIYELPSFYVRFLESNKPYDIYDIRQLSELLKEFDEYNVNDMVGKLDEKYLEQRLNIMNDYIQYWKNHYNK